MEGSLKDCCIVFDNKPDGIYFAGETVSGSVNLTLKKAKKYKEIMLRVQGSSEASWSESRTVPHGVHHHTSIGVHHHGRSHHHHHGSSHHHHHHHHHRHVNFTGKEVYFKTYNNLIQPQMTDDSAVQYEAGVHKFTFSFALPSNLPSSYEGTHGKVRYEIKVTAKRPYKSDTCFRALFTVLSIVNLNHLQGVRDPYTISKTKSFSFLLSNKGTLNLTVELPMTGYISGQNIPVKCILKNQSKVKVAELKVALIQTVVYMAQVPTYSIKTESSKILCELGGPVDKMVDQVKDIPLFLPPLPASSLNYNAVIVIKYTIQVKVKMNGMHDDVSCEFPITIGTIPFTNQLQQHNMNMAMPIQGYIPVVATASATAPPLQPTHEIFNPPTYAEAMSSGPSEAMSNHNMVGFNMNPYYPAYNFDDREPEKQSGLPGK